jgi:ATP-dependent Lhr-like helicase
MSDQKTASPAKNALRVFDPNVAEWFTATFGSPSPPQIKGWPEISAGRNVLILAPTGSGKTLAAFLWSINDLYRRLQNGSSRGSGGVHTLYISPLKALNNDIERNLRRPLTGIWNLAHANGFNPAPVRVLVRTGDTPQSVRNTIVTTPPHVLITTPESLYLLLTSKKGRQIFTDLKYLIVDEIHALCAGKRGVHLSLSLERLSLLTRSHPVRIGLSATQKPLARIARYLGGWQYDPRKEKYRERPVRIVDCGQRKAPDLEILSPVKRFSEPGEPSVWPAVIRSLYDLIAGHKTTLIFANMRAQTERVARQLNDLYREQTGDEDNVLVLPHHGSMSREKRFAVEEKLKNGDIPAVIATASLELGIDIGSIDLVILLEAPKSVANGIQRIGRSGHLISLKSKGRIIPLYPADIDDAATIVHGMLGGEIEETVIPENCLDVLAQQIVAEIAMEPRTPESLYRTVCQSYCYHNLTRAVFDQVVEMLTGRYADTRLPSLQPVIIRDVTNDRLIPRRNARLQAILNGGTIPDRGYYAVMLPDERTRIGEMEEEFVFESRIGDIFYLGNTEWRIDDIRQDRIIVTPNRSVQPREPFWKGEVPFRDYQTSLRIGGFRRWIIPQLKAPGITDILMKDYALDRESSENLIEYMQRQQQHTGSIATDKTVVAEWFYDSAREINLIIHAPFGGKVLGLWAMALSALLETRFSSQVQYSFNNDAFLLRIQESTDSPPVEELINQDSQTIENLIREKISSSPVFAIMFRHNAGRSLLLTRSRPGQRIPLWLQRLRAADLLQAVRRYPDFPILLETYRACLQDLYDLVSLQEVLRNIENGTIKTQVIKTPFPSPMASGLLFNFVSNQMYEQDRTRGPAQVAAVSSDLLAQIMDSTVLPAIIPKALIAENLDRWQYRIPASWPRDKEDLYEMIEAIGPLTKEDILRRTGESGAGNFEQLVSSGRIMESGMGWVTDSRYDLYRKPAGREKKLKRIRYFMEARGPETVDAIAGALKMDKQEIVPLLSGLQQEHRLVSGRMIEDSEDTYYCDRENFALLYRKAVAVRRSRAVAVTMDKYLRFILSWHGFGGKTETIHDIISRYRAFRIPQMFFEREILTSRVTGAFPGALTELRRMIAEGKLIAVFEQENDGREVFEKIIRRGEGWSALQPDPDDTGDDATSAVLVFLKENGASFLADMEEGLQQSRSVLMKALKELLLRGKISCENYDVLNFLNRRDRPATGRAAARKRASEAMHLGGGRWFRIDTFGVQGRKLSRTDAAALQARLLLGRYGILVKEFYRFEHGLLPWYEIFQALKTLEWQGEIRRGYFISGLSGIQFALPEAAARLEDLSSEYEEPAFFCLINVLDPALPFGGNIPWPVEFGQKIIRLPGNHLGFACGRPVVYTENYFSRWYFRQDIGRKDIEAMVDLTRNWQALPDMFRLKKSITVETIGDQAAAHHPLSRCFLAAGYEKDETRLVLWPSAV